MNAFTKPNSSIHELLEKRWSPRAFSSQLPSQETLTGLFEAARWTPSAMNAQPWHFILTTTDQSQSYDSLFSTLRESNQGWAQTAPVLVLTVMKTLRPDGNLNRFAPYDLGQAVAHLTIQAMSQGLYVHQMGGFDREKAAKLFQLPQGYEAMTVLAIGYLGDPAALPEGIESRKKEDRSRNPLEEVLF